MNAGLEAITTNARPRLEGIESLRAVAAIMIILHHMVLLPNPNISLPDYLFFVKERFALGVPLFFALSGFVLAYGYMDKLADRQSIIKFYIRRYFRIAPLFYFMIAVWIMATKIKWGHFPASFHDLTLNLLLLFGLIPGKHESIVWAGWSIGVEILFYMLFPLVAAMINGVRTGVLALAIAILISSSSYSVASAVNIGSYAYMNVVTHFPTFLAGVLGYLIWRKTGFMQSRVMGGLIMFATLISILCVTYFPAITAALNTIKGVRLDIYVWSVMFMMLILSISLWPNKLVTNVATTHLGKISFSLYLWHPLIVISLIDVYVLIGSHLGSGLKNFLACAVVTLGAVIMAAFFSYRFVESPGMAYGKKIANSL